MSRKNDDDWDEQVVTKPTSTLDETLSSMGEAFYPTHTYGNNYEEENVKAIAQAHRAIATALEAIIGEKHPEADSEDGFSWIDAMAEIQNQLIDEQLERLALYLNPNSQETQ